MVLPLFWYYVIFMIVLRSLIKKNVDHTFKNFLSVLLIAWALYIQDHKKLQYENQYIKKLSLWIIIGHGTVRKVVYQKTLANKDSLFYHLQCSMNYVHNINELLGIINTIIIGLSTRLFLKYTSASIWLYYLPWT